METNANDTATSSLSRQLAWTKMVAASYFLTKNHLRSLELLLKKPG